MTTPRGTTPKSRFTIADVAALAGVSPGAVSKVFNKNGRISEATSQRVREAARKLNWAPNASAAALRTSRTLTIGLVLSGTRNPDVSASNVEFLSGIESVLSPKRYGLLLNFYLEAEHNETEFYRTLAECQRMDGIILTNSAVGDTRFELLKSLQLPAVLVGTPWKPGVIDYVDADPPDAGISDAVEHLITLGHRRIAYVSGPEELVLPRIRREAVVNALVKHGLDPYAIASGSYSPEFAERETVRFLEAGTPPTAILYGSDTMAIAGMRTVQARGLRVPDDISIVGHEGLPLGEWIDPPLTTVQRFGFQRGRAAAAALLGLLGEDTGGYEPMEKPVLIVRGSTGVVRPRA